MTRFASSHLKAIYQELKKPFYKLFELKLLTPGVDDNYQFVIKKEFSKDEYINLINKMCQHVGDKFKAPSVSLRKMGVDWHEDHLGRIRCVMDYRYSLESYVDCKEISSCLLLSH